ncbi:MAG: agmatinase [Candidatus Saganbacteria bacterium]|nr:agmatinase [Candidatus Saganbacteria bacterium]
MFTILPVPHEATTSYGKGTRNGPAAILKALKQVEEFDEELKLEIRPGKEYTIAKPASLASLVARYASLLSSNTIPVMLGGEHSITSAAVKTCAQKFKNLSVLQFDAHADLRDKYQGRKDSHACAIRRVLEICPAVQVGIRSISKEEYDWAEKSGQLKKMHLARKIEPVDKIEAQLSQNVYITIDVDVFDPSIIPSTGTPEPGGMLWYEVLDILKGVCATKNVVGFDVVELSPKKGDIVSDFTAARLVHKVMGYISSKKQ